MIILPTYAHATAFFRQETVWAICPDRFRNNLHQLCSIHKTISLLLSISSAKYVTVHSHILVGRFHACMKICLHECAKGAPFL